MNVPETDEAELKVQTVLMYKNGGIKNVLDCIVVMQKCQTIILTKLAELIMLENAE